MAAAQNMTREEEYLIEEDLFRRNAFLVISKMVDLSPGHPSELMDEILHSIFFLGKIIPSEIKNSPHSPERIVTDGEMLQALRSRYPKPFKYYSSQLPKRSPISCVLDMIVHLMGQEKEDEIIKNLQKLILQLKEGNAKYLVSSTICVSQRDKTGKSVRYYGVSMSNTGRDPRRIMIAASCLSTWDSYVADAVMTYYPSTKKKKYFDGTIILPEQVRCEAFNIRNGEHMDPCKSCGNLFGLTTSVTKVWPYGNCAEAESVSNLLKNEGEVRKKTQLKSKADEKDEKKEKANRETAKKEVKTELWRCLNQAKFKWDENFYTPQAVKP